MNKLPPGLEDFGARLEQAAEREVEERRQRRRRRSLRSFGLPVVAALAAAGATAGAVRVVDGGGDPIQRDSGDRGKSLEPARDPAVVMASAVPDPGGGPPWVLRAYTDADGRECVQIGQLRNGLFGEVQHGQFRALPASAHGSCAREHARVPLIVVGRRGPVDLTLVYGLAIDRSTVTVTVGDRTRRLQPAGLGAFLAVFTGADPRQRIVVRSQVAGHTDVRRFP